MILKICLFLESVSMTLLGGLFLGISLVLMLLEIEVIFDPAWGAVIICGIPLIYLALQRLFCEKKISSALLISIAMISAIGIGELFAAGEVAFIMALGAILENKTVERAHKGIRALIALTPQTGRRVCINPQGNELVEMISAETIQKGNRLRVFPGETIPVDGTVFCGQSTVNQSIMTGESLPIEKNPGDIVYGGTLNTFGTMDLIATRVGEDSTLQKMILRVKEAEKKKAPTQRIVDRWAQYLVPIALLIAVITYGVTLDLSRAVTVLVVFCPCALVLATPTAIMAAIGQATHHGVLIKSGEALERMGKVNNAVFDKTGTLTYGRLELSDCFTLSPDFSEAEWVQLAASAESRSEHPLGKAFVKFAQDKGYLLLEPVEFQMIPGRGISAQVNDQAVFCERISTDSTHVGLLDENIVRILNTLRTEGKSSVIVKIGQTCVGIVAFSDVLRPEAPSVITHLKKLKMSVHLLSGDHIQTATYFASQAGIENIKGELFPDDKVLAIEKLQASGNRVCMIGDGVNDAPALKTADVGIAMGSIGSDLAIESADIALMGDDLSLLPYLKRLSDATLFSITFNISLSMAINIVAIILSVLGLLTPVTGALVHNVGSVLVVLNAALLYDRKFI